MSAPGGSITIAGKAVSRIGLGTMGLTGPGHWGPPPDRVGAVRLLRLAVDAGVTHLDTADAYGPHTVEELICEALHPYPPELLVATKVGMIRPGPNRWRPLGRPDYLRHAVEASLRRLGVERLALCYLHRVDPETPLTDQVAELAALRQEGKIAAVGLSKVTVAQAEEAMTIVPVAAVQNVLNRSEPDDPTVDWCRTHRIPFVPYRPLAAGRLATGTGPGDALRWLLDRGSHVAPIPGTRTATHLAELLASAAGSTAVHR
ncbi:aldo/keto reductase [Streptacidiphilus sp. ASG 303]|uniref:aldo/keto reductase n=1 Tax=Streptacidiphilus sp. ASG 303 TaxID=2896847 RepID=UPI001E5F8CFF|nr:aldo/keto reductase [Streptacidiphilus sp. ASG 303]MCD0485210.1 aldo/keto reductase [Streptacidiphilus sp. ASG 303]